MEPYEQQPNAADAPETEQSATDKKAKWPRLPLPTVMPMADFRRLLKPAVKGKTKSPTPPPPLTGGYLFFGEEDYLKFATVSDLRKYLFPGDDPMRAFNDQLIDGADFSIGAIQSALFAPPMGSDRKLVTVTDIAFEKLKQAEGDDLLALLDSLPDCSDCCLLLIATGDRLNFGSIDANGYFAKNPSPSAMFTQLAARLTPVYFPRIGGTQMLGWIQKHFLANGIKAQPPQCRRVLEICGADMFTLVGEINKISYFSLSRGHEFLEDEDITAVACPTVEYSAYAFSDAILKRDRVTALGVLSELQKQKTPPQLVLGQIASILCVSLSVKILTEQGKTAGEIAYALKMNEFRVKTTVSNSASTTLPQLRRIVSAVSEVDALVKLSSDADAYRALAVFIGSL